MADVKMMQGLQAGYDALPEKYGDTVYLCTDTGRCYLGTKLLSPRVAQIYTSGEKVYYNGSDVTSSADLESIVQNAKGDWYGSQTAYDELDDGGTVQADILYHIEVQADWNENDDAHLGFIKNKPNIPYVVIAEKTFDPYTITAADTEHGYLFFLNVVPTSDNYYEPWRIKYRLFITTTEAQTQGIYDCELGTAGTGSMFSFFNRFYSTNRYPSRSHIMAFHNSAAKYADRATNPIKIGERINGARLDTTLARTFKIQVIEAVNCTVSFPDDIEVYDDVYTDAKYGSCPTFDSTTLGLCETNDVSYPNYYNYEYNQSYRIHSADTPLYRYKFCGFDEQDRLVPITSTNQTNATIVTKTPNTVPMDVSKGLIWYNTATVIDSVSTAIGLGVLYRSASANQMLNYNFNTAIAANTNVFLVGSYDATTGMFVLDTTSANSYYLYAPNDETLANYLTYFTTGKYYWLIGNTTASYVNFLIDNPLFYFDGTNLISVVAASYNSIKDYVDTQIGELPNPMIFKGSVGTGGTIEWANLPTASASEGYTYKVITAHDTTPVCEVGDTIISNGSEWVVIPSGDEPSGTVTSITAGAGLNTTSADTGTDGGTITTSGTLYLTKSGVTANNYGPSSNPSPAFGGSFNVPYIVVDKYGRVTSASNKTVTVPAFVKSDWTQETLSHNAYILNRPEVRTSTGAKSLKLNDIDHNVASGEFSTSEGETTSAFGEASHAEGIGIEHNNIPFTVDEFFVRQSESSSFNSSDFSGHVGDIIIFDGIQGTYTVSNIERLTITFTPSILNPRATEGEIIVEGTNSGAYGNASHAEGSGTTAWGTSSHAEGSSDVTFSENDITVSFDEVKTNLAYLADHHDYLPVVGDRFEYNSKLYTVYDNDPNAGEGEFYFYPEFDTAPSGAQTITVYHFDSGAIGENSHVEGLNTIALNDNEHAEGRYNVSTVNEEPELSTIHSIGIGDGNAYRRNAVEVSGRGEVYIKDVGGYNGENMNGSGVSDLATVIGTIPSPANSGKMKISANSDSAVNTLFNANSSSDTNAIKFIDGTNTQVTVTAASGSTPATVKYDFTGTIPAEPFVVMLDYDGEDWGHSRVPQGTYQSIDTAVGQGKDVVVKVFSSSTSFGFTIIMHLSQIDDADAAYTFYSGTNINNESGDSVVSLTIYDDDTIDCKKDVALSSGGYFQGLLNPNAVQSDASILTHTNQPLATTAAAQTDDTKPVSAKNVYQLFNGLNTNTIKPVFSHFYDTDENFKAPSTASTYNTAEYCNRYFMKVIPDGAGEYWSVFYHVHIEVPDYTTKIFTDSYIEFYGNGDGLTCYKIWNTLSGTANYYHCAFWLTAAGLSTDYGHAIGESIMSSTARNLARTMSVEVFAYDGCTVELLPHLLKWSEWDGADSTNYKTATNAAGTAGAGSPSTYNSTTNGLQETSDADTVTTISLAYTPLVAGTYGMKQHSLVMQDANGKWQSFTTTSGATGYSGGNFTNIKTMNPSGFRLGSRIYYMNMSSDVAANATSVTAYAYRPRIDFRYTLNVTNVASSATAGYRNGNLVANKPVYIVGHMGNDGLFYLDADADGNWWTQEPTLASGQTEDGKIYIRICESTSDNYRGDPITDGYAFWFKDGVFQRYFGTSDDVVSREENNAALLSGYCSELGYISTGKLLVYDGYTLQALYEDDNNGFSSEYFPIGSHIYAYMGNQMLTDEEVSGLKVYDSYYNVPLTENGVPIDQEFADNFSDYDAVWLEVLLDNTCTQWRPIGITGSTGLGTKRFYIYLGSYTGTTSGQSQADADKFMLEVKNEMYFRDGSRMIPFTLWQLEQEVGWIEAQLAAI